MPEVSPDVVLAQLQPIYQEALNEPGLTVTRSSNANNTKNWDSLAHIELIEMVESHFKVRFALGELEELKEVGDLVDFIVAKVAAKG
jgi:acyl carrier protein